MKTVCNACTTTSRRLRTIHSDLLHLRIWNAHDAHFRVICGKFRNVSVSMTTMPVYTNTYAGSMPMFL